MLSFLCPVQPLHSPAEIFVSQEFSALPSSLSLSETKRYLSPTRSMNVFITWIPAHPQRGKEETIVKRGPVPSAQTSRSFYGATYLLDMIGDKLGITEDLKDCFPGSYRQILSIAYYLAALEDQLHS